MSAAGRVMLVTGASRGIGAAIARRAAQSGWRIGVNYVASDDAARHVVETVRAAGSDAVSAPADVSDPAATAEMFDMVEHALGPIRALVCNAGVDREAAVADATDEDVRRIVAVNALGPIWCAREAVRRMSTAHGGSGGAIVNVSSIAASKGAVDAFTRGLAKEVAGEGIRVCAVRPGLIRTEMWDTGMGRDAVVELGISAVPMQLLFRNQSLDAPGLAAFSRRFGCLAHSCNQRYSAPDAADVMLVGNLVVDGEWKSMFTNGMEDWHVDQIYTQTPNTGTLLYAVEVPPVGGDTLFAGMTAGGCVLSPPRSPARASRQPPGQILHPSPPACCRTSKRIRWEPLFEPVSELFTEQPLSLLGFPDPRPPFRMQPY